MTSKTVKDDRSTNWAFLVYPDSAPDGWMDILAAQDIDILISPLHDPDGIAESGVSDPGGLTEHAQLRKPHYHVQLIYGCGHKKSRSQVEDLASKVNGVHPIKLSNKEGYAKYLLHLGDRHKNKQQWPIGTKPIIFGDIDYFELIDTDYNVQQHVKDIMQYIKDNDLKYLYQIADYASIENQSWFNTVTTKRTLFIDRYLQSRRQKALDDKKDLESNLYR